MEEMKENRTTESSVSFLPLPGVFVPSYPPLGCIISIKTGGDSRNLFTFSFFSTNMVMERMKRGKKWD